jgi:hypothetical protein
MKRKQLAPQKPRERASGGARGTDAERRLAYREVAELAKARDSSRDPTRGVRVEIELIISALSRASEGGE